MDSVIVQHQQLLQKLLKEPDHPFGEGLLKVLPKRAGVYRIFAEGEEIEEIYVGQTTNLQSRIYGSHLMGNRGVAPIKRKLIKNGQYPDENSVKEYLKSRCRVQFIEVPDDSQRKFFEHFVIAILKPRWND